MNDDSTLYRVVTIGDSSVGKTSLINRLVNHTFDAHESPTIGAMFVLYDTYVGENHIEMQIWDTAGQEKFRSLGPIYYRNASAGIVVFDLTQSASFTDLDSWIDAFSALAQPNATLAVVGNKADLSEYRQVPYEQAKDWAEERNFLYFETSAATGAGIDLLFKAISVELDKKDRSLHSSNNPMAIQNAEAKPCC